MKYYVGIDLGTTNSAICTYDGENIRLFKSPEQNDVTPSAIFIDKRGNKYFGRHAYENAARSPDNAAIKFKRMMGTSTPIKLPAVDITMTPEECSAEILKVCFGYLPEEIRNDSETGTVITVPAAFNQMQKDATMAAAELAGLGKVALMQEPVAAVMSEMRNRKSDGTFLVYDLGGGTLDVAIATSTKGRVSLQSHGGIAMCGGTDFDRILLDNIVKPWLLDNFQIPDDFNVNPKYKKLIRMAIFATEKAKIALSSSEESIISLMDSELNVRDESDAEIYLDIPISRDEVDKLISPRINDSIIAARETMEKAGLTANDIERIVFVGGPTHYKPLRDKVSFELGIASSNDINPMTAVAEGAAVFAEAIDWSSESRGRKSNRGALSAGGKFDLSFNYIARTPDNRAKIAAILKGTVIEGAEFQVDSLDTGWSSGRVTLQNGATIEVNLSKPGENTFKIFVFDAQGGPVLLVNNKIAISRTAATIDAIPSSSSIGIEINKKGRLELVYLVNEGDALPKEGIKEFRATESLRAGSNSALHFIIREGEIKNPISDNRFIGELTIKGTDFDNGVISQGDELICKYKVLDSGQITLSVSVPKIGGVFGDGKSFYSRQEAQIDFTNASKKILEEVDLVREKIETISEKIDDPKLNKALDKLDEAQLKSGESDPDIAKKAMDNVFEAKKLLDSVRKSNVKVIRQIDLDNCVDFFDESIREIARSTEANAFDNLARTAQRSIDSNTNDFDNLLDELRGRNWEILWRQDWFIVETFKRFSDDSWQFADLIQFEKLVMEGNIAIKTDDIDKLRIVLARLYTIRISNSGDGELLASSNITEG